MQRQPYARNLIRKYSLVLMISGLVFVLLLFITCGSVYTNGTDTSNTNTAFTTPSVDMALKSHGGTQLQTFQQWIILMK